MKKPRPGGGVFGICSDDEVSKCAQKSEVPEWGPFFELAAHDFVIICK